MEVSRWQGNLGSEFATTPTSFDSKTGSRFNGLKREKPANQTTVVNQNPTQNNKKGTWVFFSVGKRVVGL